MNNTSCPLFVQCSDLGGKQNYFSYIGCVISNNFKSSALVKNSFYYNICDSTAK